MGYKPCEIEPDIWRRDCGEHYEHISVCVDDLLMLSKEPHAAVNALTKIIISSLRARALCPTIYDTILE